MARHHQPIISSQDYKQYCEHVTESETLNEYYICQAEIIYTEKSRQLPMNLLFQSDKKTYVSSSVIFCPHLPKTNPQDLEYQFEVDVVGNFLEKAYLEWSRPGIFGYDCKKTIKSGLSMSVPVKKTKLCYDKRNGLIYDKKGRKHDMDESEDDDDCKHKNDSSSCTSYCPKKHEYNKFLHNSSSSSSSSSSSDCSTNCDCNKNKYIKCHVDPKCVFGTKEDTCQTTFAYYTQGFALAAIDSVSLEQHNTMQTLTGNTIHMFHELYVEHGKRNYNMLGFYRNENQAIVDSIRKTKLFVELPFLFSHSEGDCIFLNHIQKKKLKVCLKRQPLKRLLHRSSCSVKIMKTCDNKQIKESDIGVKLITCQQLLHKVDLTKIESICTERKLVNCLQGRSIEFNDTDKPNIPIYADGIIRSIHFAVQTKKNFCDNNHFNYNTELGSEPVCNVKLYYGSSLRMEGSGAQFRDLANSYAGLNAVAWNIYTIPLTAMLQKSCYTGGVNSSKENITLELELDKKFSNEKYSVKLLYNTNAMLSYEHCSMSSDMNENVIVLRYG